MTRGISLTGNRKERFRHTLGEAQDWFCHYCKIKMWCPGCSTGLPRRMATFEHVLARVYGGKFNRDNIVLACWRCNHKKGDRMDERSEGYQQYVERRALEPRTEDDAGRGILPSLPDTIEAF